MKDSALPQTILCIREWSQAYESDRTARVVDATWFKLSNRLDGNTFLDIVDHENGAAHWGCWIVLCMIASRSSPRGFILRDGGEPHTPDTVARQSRLTKDLCRQAIERFLEMGFLVVGQLPPPAQSSAPQHDAPKPNGKHDEPLPAVDSDFPQFWQRWCDGTKRGVGEGKARIEFNRHLAPVKNRAAFEVCFQSYLRSGDVHRGAAMNPARWITECAKNGWSDRWPEPKKSRADEVEENLRRMHE